jgi:hypothetical protein
MHSALWRSQRSAWLFLPFVICAPVLRAEGQAPLPASVVEPPELALLKRAAVEKRPASPRTPSLKQVFDALRRQPGGAATIERARRAGARIPRDVAVQPQSSDDQLGTGNLSIAARELGSGSAATQNTPTVRITRASWNQSVTGLGRLYAYAWWPTWINTYSTWGPLVRAVVSGTGTVVGAPYDVKPYMFISFNATTSGWYVLNVVAEQSAFEARHFTGTDYQLIQSFPRPAVAGSYSYPVLVNLAAGQHYFTWANFDWIYVSEISVAKF